MTNQDKIVSSMDSRELRLKVFGVGGAGFNAVEHFAHSEFAGVEFVAVNTDVQALLDLSVGRVVPLGATLTRGLGAGGDPEVGRAAAEEDAEQLCRLCAGAKVVVIVTGLGGGTGTGASPVLARAAKEAGALVLAIATLPFESEGARRRSQAQAGLEELKETAESVLVGIVAGSDLTMAEVNRVMSQFNHACEYAHIIMGAAVEAELGDRLSVTVIAARQSEAGAADAVTAPAVLREGDEARSKR